MIVDERNYLGLSLKYYQKNITESWMSFKHDSWSQSDYKLREELINNYFIESGNKNFLISKTALSHIDLIKIGDKFDFTLLSGISSQRGTYLIDDKICFRFFIENEHLRVICVKIGHKPDNPNWMDYCIFYCNTTTGFVKNVDPSFDYDIELFLKCLIFIEIADSEVVFIEPGRKVGTRKDGYYNLTPSKLIIVKSTWNKIIVRTEGFAVSGHFRLQRVGVKRSEVKLIWIDPFVKNGYIRTDKNISIPSI